MKIHVAELWRYPVKSLAGEPLDSPEIWATAFRGTASFKYMTPRAGS